MPQHRTRNKRRTSLQNYHAFALSPFIYAQHSIACERHPNRNEDSTLVDELGGLAAVFDGVGGSAAGEIASRTAARAARRAWRRLLNEQQNGRKIPTYLEYCDKLDLCSTLHHLIEEADDLVRTEGARRAGTDDLATTVAVAAFCRQPGGKGYTMIYAHVGDSRIYLLRGDEPLKRLTNDDGLLGKLVESQLLNEEDALRIDQAMRTEQLSDTEYNYFRLRGGITQALGGPLPPAIHTAETSIQPGDRILLCTDGIHDNLVDEEIEAILRQEPRHSVARTLVERSLHRSHQERHQTVRAKPDDMSAVVITCRF